MNKWVTILFLTSFSLAACTSTDTDPHKLANQPLAPAAIDPFIPAYCSDRSALSADEVGSGGVGFEENLVLSGYQYAYGVKAADLNQDGLVDLITADAHTGIVHWSRNLGGGQFQTIDLPDHTAGWMERGQVADLDMDGNLDLVFVLNENHGLIWYKNPIKNSQPNRDVNIIEITNDFAFAYDVVVADVDGDGYPDVAGTSWRGQEIAWFKNPGNGSGHWAKNILASGIGITRGIQFGDINGDGRPDIVASSQTGNLVLWLENKLVAGRTQFATHTIDSTLSNPEHGQVVDMDADGDLDVVMGFGFPDATTLTDATSRQIGWYENLGSGSSWTYHFVSKMNDTYSALVADMDGDGKLDIVANNYGATCHEGSISYFTQVVDSGTGAVSWEQHPVTTQKWSRNNEFVISDLDGDGRLDIASVAEYGINELRWWRNLGGI